MMNHHHQLQLEYLTKLIIILNNFKYLEDQSESENIILKKVNKRNRERQQKRWLLTLVKTDVV